MRRWLNGIWMAMLAVGLAGAGLLATAANAQGRMVSRFTLPCETNWAGRILPAGDYTMTVPPLDLTPYVRVEAVNGSGQVYIPSGVVGQKSGDKNMLVLTETKETKDRCVVRAVNLADINVEIIYKPIGGSELAALRRDQAERRMVSLVTKR